jgi:hypothetical protein
MDDALGIGKAVEGFERLTRESREVLQAYFQPILEAKGKARAEVIRYEHQKRMIDIMLETQRLARESGLRYHPPTEKIAYSILDSASREADPALSQRWARLLASAITGKTVHPSFPKILEELDINEVHLLDQLYRSPRLSQGASSSNDHAIKALKAALAMPSLAFEIALYTAMRHRLVEHARGDMGSFWKDRGEDENVDLTVLGVEFIKACNGPVS